MDEDLKYLDNHEKLQIKIPDESKNLICYYYEPIDYRLNNFDVIQICDRDENDVYIDNYSLCRMKPT